MTVPDVKETRSLWKAHIPEFDVNKLVFLDESGININMTRHYGRSVKKARVNDSTPLNTPVTTTLLSSIRLNGETVHITYPGGTSGEQFVEYLKKELIPCLHPGDIVVMDNMRSHHVEEVGRCLKAAKMNFLYLPPYSPDFNPIEEMWSKLKSILRHLKVRVASQLSAAVDAAFRAIRDSDCRGWFSLCGYLQ